MTFYYFQPPLKSRPPSRFLLQQPPKAYVIQLLIDTIFILLFYPLLLSFSTHTIIAFYSFFLAGIGDLLENCFTALVLYNQTYVPDNLYIPVIATSIKFLFLIIGVITLIFTWSKSLRKIR